MAHRELNLRERRAIEDMLNAKIAVREIAVEDLPEYVNDETELMRLISPRIQRLKIFMHFGGIR